MKLVKKWKQASAWQYTYQCYQELIEEENPSVKELKTVVNFESTAVFLCVCIDIEHFLIVETVNSEYLWGGRARGVRKKET